MWTPFQFLTSFGLLVELLNPLILIGHMRQSVCHSDRLRILFHLFPSEREFRSFLSQNATVFLLQDYNLSQMTQRCHLHSTD